MLERLITAAAVAVLTAAAPIAAQAAPVHYDVTFDATQGASGSGSFLFDADTNAMTAFTWGFGSGPTGALTDGSLAVVLDLTLGEVLFDFATTGSSGSLASVHFPVGLIGPFPNGLASFCSTSGSANCNVPSVSGLAAYAFFDISGVYRGYFSAAPASEPATLALLGLSLVALGVVRRARG